jgi:hypothetical protein
MLRCEAEKLRCPRLSGTDMPDDHRPLMPRRNPEDNYLGAIKDDLEFLIEQTERFRREQALRPLYVMVGSAAVIGQVALSQRSCRSGRKPNFAASFLAHFETRNRNLFCG